MSAETFTGESWDIGYSAQQLQDAVANQVPRINSTTKHWEVWSIENNAWIDTGVVAQGGGVTSFNGRTGAVTPQSGDYTAAMVGASAKALAFTVTLSASGWSNNAQTVSSASFVVSGCSYVVSPASASLEAYAEAQIYADDVTTAGQMTFHCGEVPSAALTVNVIRVEVQ